MSVPLPPPLPDPAAVRRSIRLWKGGIWLGGILMASPVWGTIPGLMQLFGTMDGDISKAAVAITGGVAAALKGALIGLATCPVGVLLLVMALRRLGPLKQQLAGLDGNHHTQRQVR